MTTSSKPQRSLELFEFAPGKMASWSTLSRMLPDIKTALFFAKAFNLDYVKLSKLVSSLFDSPVLDALNEGGHSVSLQDYLVDTVPPDVWPENANVCTEDEVPAGEFLPELWDAAAITIAKSIAEVAEKVASVLDRLPSKEGNMVFQHLAKVNLKRPTIGTFTPGVHHAQVPNNLVILDVSGSMTESTIARIIEDVIALSWKVNATLAIVSNSTFVWEPGTYRVEAVMDKAEFGGTQYETLAPLFDKRSWGTVITIADYDSSPAAKGTLAKATGRIDQLFDISLVNRPTYLAACVGQLADKIEPLLIATSRNVLSN